MAWNFRIGGLAIGFIVEKPKHSTAGEASKPKPRHALSEIVGVARKGDRIWSLIFIAFCALMSTLMWAQSVNLWTDVDTIPRHLLRLIAPVTVFVVPIIFYACYKRRSNRKTGGYNDQ